MTTVVLCAWSSVAILVCLVAGKYRWTAPPWGVLITFAAVAWIAGNCAGWINAFIARETEFWFFSADRYTSGVAMLLGAGLGEEFWKLAWGMVILLVLAGMGRAPRPVGIVLAFVVLGLSFATFENLASYSGIGFWPLVTRGVTAVPLHASMSMIHGLGAVSALRRRAAWPVLVAYLLSAGLHAFYNTLPQLFPRLPAVAREMVVFGNARFGELWDMAAGASIYPFVALLVVWAYVVWQRLPEVDPEDLGEAVSAS